MNFETKQDLVDFRLYNVHYGTGLERNKLSHKKAFLEGRIPKGISRNAGIDNPNAKLTDDDVRYIRENYKKYDPDFCGYALAKKFGITRTTVYKIVSGKKRGSVK